MPSHPPVAPFVVGMGRSGTTLLRLMLNSHPLLAVPPETRFLHALLEQEGRTANASEAFCATLRGTPTWPDFDLDAAELRRRVDSLAPFSLPDAVRAFYAYYAESQGKPLWGDKTPTYGLLLADIGALLPEARFVHLLRDGRDSALSYRRVWFGPGRDLVQHARTWTERVSRARALGAALGQRYLEIRYEDLVSQPAASLAAVCAFLDLPFSERMLDYHLTAAEHIARTKPRHRPDGSLAVGTEHFLEIHARTMTPPDPTRIGGWRRELSDDELRSYERCAGRLLQTLGYETRFPDAWEA